MEFLKTLFALFSSEKRATNFTPNPDKSLEMNISFEGVPEEMYFFMKTKRGYFTEAQTLKDAEYISKLFVHENVLRTF